MNDLGKKNLELGKLVDERIWEVSGNIEKQERMLLGQVPRGRVGGRAKLDSDHLGEGKCKNQDSDIYQKICRFEDKQAGSSYNREYTPSLNAIIKETKAGVSYKDFGRKIEKIDLKRQELAASAKNLIHILDSTHNPLEKSLKTQNDAQASNTYQTSISKNQTIVGGKPSTKILINPARSHSVDPLRGASPKKKRSRLDIYGPPNPRY